MAAQAQTAASFHNPAAALATPRAQRASFWRRAWDGMVARSERLAMARLATIDPRLAKEIQAARDRAEW